MTCRLHRAASQAFTLTSRVLVGLPRKKQSLLICSNEQLFMRKFSSSKRSLVLGIESSCDDTGCAIVDSDGRILGEALHSQMQVHLEHGGIVPPTARRLHAQHIESVVQEALENSGINLKEIDAVATAVKPGLPMSLTVGTNYGKKIAREHDKPFIPIHHMEAHALMVRMFEKVDFPFLVLLASGGHCLLALALGLENFLLFGQSLDDAPGEAFDKTARRLSLRHIPELSHVCGGKAIEILASRGNPNAFVFNPPLCKYRDCNFSVAGLKNCARRQIMRLETKYDKKEGEVVPEVEDVCASFQFTMARHLCQRVQRGMDFIESRNLLPKDRKSFVISGGVGCNMMIRKSLQLVCDEYGYSMYAPPPRLCTDNGVMIAWNGMEKWLAGVGITRDLDSLSVQGRCMLGTDWREEVAKANIKCHWVKLKKLLDAS